MASFAAEYRKKLREQIQEAIKDYQEFNDVTKLAADQIKTKLGKYGPGIVVISNDCSVCDDLRSYLEDDNRAIIVSIDDDDGWEIAHSAYVQGVPRFLTKENGIAKKYKIEAKGLVECTD